MPPLTKGKVSVSIGDYKRDFIVLFSKSRDAINEEMDRGQMSLELGIDSPASCFFACARTRKSFITFTTAEPDIVAHEASHVVFEFLYDLDLKSVPYNTQEVFAYLLGKLVRDILKIAAKAKL